MGRVSNETNLVVALLKEKAKAEKQLSSRQAKVLKEENQQVFYEKGINWVLNTLDQILQDEIIGK